MVGCSDAGVTAVGTGFVVKPGLIVPVDGYFGASAWGANGQSVPLRVYPDQFSFGPFLKVVWSGEAIRRAGDPRSDQQRKAESFPAPWPRIHALSPAGGMPPVLGAPSQAKTGH